MRPERKIDEQAFLITYAYYFYQISNGISKKIYQLIHKKSSNPIKNKVFV
jgi:hypothetical protein